MDLAGPRSGSAAGERHLKAPRALRGAGLLSALLLLIGPAQAQPEASSVLWYDQPARTWMTEALPIGEGALGAMLFGLTDTERVQFNHDTLWTGSERTPADTRPSAMSSSS